MDLLIDIGNTHLKWCWLEEGDRSAVRLEPHGGDIPSCAAAVWTDITTLPARVFVASVAGPAAQRGILAFASARWQVAPRVVCSQARGYGIVNGYQEPEQLGVDRWLAMVAARKLFKEPLLIVDCGTAVTCDLVDRQGRHHGGLILPGLAMMQDALSKRTAIPRVEAAPCRSLLARNTAEAINAGALQAVAGLVERLQRKTQSELREQPSLVLSGGDASAIAEELNCRRAVHPDLVMQGLAIVAQGGDGR